MTRLQIADLTSGVGAVVLGLGLGALWSEWLKPAAGLIPAVGLVMHGFGMWDKHRREPDATTRDSRWTLAMYWGCWLLLAGVVGLLVFRIA
ncbi:hypothetical protein [Luteitalea sp.]|uniref:hypothetical protein n=1 Tax=Luteitalea sp. TaxID=2004800 RepID=UPI0025BAF339|nr:hypothetical protein [Luteitalea sp.]